MNVDLANSMTVARDDSADLINGSASDYTLALNSTITFHNTGISGIGWATIFTEERGAP